METIIKNKLIQIEKEKEIRILYSNESGSRAWGFPSPDSDYDVRFIYMHKMNNYFSLTDKKDHLDFPLSEELDIYGWDIKKVLKLILKSNTTPFEWLQSPIVYQSESTFSKDLWELCPHYFNARKNALHYLGIAHSAIKTIEEGELVKIKKLFYILRPLFAAKWCIEKNSIAPMTIQPLLELAPAEIQEIVNKIIIQKLTAAEGFIISIPQVLKSFIDNEFNQLSEAASKLEDVSFDLSIIDDFYLNTLKKYDY